MEMDEDLLEVLKKNIRLRWNPEEETLEYMVCYEMEIQDPSVTMYHSLCLLTSSLVVHPLHLDTYPGVLASLAGT